MGIGTRPDAWVGVATSSDKAVRVVQHRSSQLSQNSPATDKYETEKDTHKM